MGIIQPRGFPGLPPDWSIETDSFLGADGRCQLFFTVFRKTKLPDSARVLIVIHGQGEHGGRYMHLPAALESHIDAVACLDLRGHGRSEGLRGHVEDFDEYTRDAVDFVRRMNDRFRSSVGTLPHLHLLGHSMGGLIGLRVLLQEPHLPLKSAAISAPLLGLHRVPPVKLMAAKLVNCVWGSLQLSNEVDVTAISRDEAVQEAYRSDRLIHDRVTPRFYFSLVEKMGETLSHRVGIRVPTLFLVPLADRVVDPAKALEFARHHVIEDKKIIELEGYFHESLNDRDKERPLSELDQWIKKHS